MDFSHSELVKKAAEWLKKQRNTAVITEVKAGREAADAFGWRSGNSTLVECKASRADFFADRKKAVRTHGYMAIGRKRYYLCPEGMVSPDELLHGWGLLEINGKGIRKKVDSVDFADADYHGEVLVLLSLLRRIGQDAPEGVSISCYTYETKNTATLGISIDEAET